MITERQAHIWFMHHAGMSVKQIADKLACSPQSVQDALNRARRKAMMLGMRVVREEKIPAPVFEMPQPEPLSRFEKLKLLAQ
jgi:transposase